MSLSLSLSLSFSEIRIIYPIKYTKHVLIYPISATFLILIRFVRIARAKENIINLYASNPSVNNNKRTAINVPSNLICYARGDAAIYCVTATSLEQVYF